MESVPDQFRFEMLQRLPGWPEFLSRESTRVVDVLHRSVQTVVYRIKGSDQSDCSEQGNVEAKREVAELGAVVEQADFVVKVCDRPESILREQAAYEHVVRPLSLPSPEMILSYAGNPVSWIIYRDNRLQSIGTDALLFLDGLRVACALHQHDPRTIPLHRDLASHTPDFFIAVREVRSTPFSRYCKALDSFAWARASDVKLLQVLHHKLCVSCDDDPLLAIKVLCHGDLHLGNLMWSSIDERLNIIDWEFVHCDYIYFDLFQLLDATSPFIPLQRVMGRVDALRAYYDCNQAVQKQVARRDFEQGYMRFAATYLYWIMNRMIDDLEANRHDVSQLMRQRVETVAALVEIASSYT